MKRNILKITLVVLMLTGFGAIYPAFSDAPPPPPPPQNGEQNNVPGGGAPIGEGLLILTLLGTGYAAKKWNMAKSVK